MQSTRSSAESTEVGVADGNRLIADYVRRLERELADLPRSARNDLIDEIEEHISEALAEQPDARDAEILTLLDRIGDPADIADEARGRFGPAPSRPSHALEIAALILILPGSVILPFLGWLAGVVMLWVSNVWTTRDKLIGTLLVPGGLMPAFMMFFGVVGSSTQSCTTTLTGPSGVLEETCTGGLTGIAQAAMLALGVFVILAPLATTAYLAHRLRQARG